ncbi:MAG: DUF3078 domain-containing protein [bacterium]
MKKWCLLALAFCLGTFIAYANKQDSTQLQKVSNRKHPKKDSIETYYIVIWGNGFFSAGKSTYKDWQKAGENNFALLFEVEPYFKTNSKKLFQDQRLLIRYGVLKYKDLVRQKSDDELSFQSKWNRHLSKKLDIQFLLKYQTQINDTYKIVERSGIDTNILHSGFMSPGYIHINLGFEYSRDKRSRYAIGLSGLKITTVKNQELYEILDRKTLFKVPKGKHELIEYGFHINIEIKKDISKNIEIEHKSRYFIQEDRFKNIDIESRTLISFKVSKHIKTMLTHQLIYDDDVLDRYQVMQQLMLGYYF